jgi:hypothetical protein
LSEQVTKRALTEEVLPILMAMVEPLLSGDIYPKGMVQTLRIGQTMIKVLKLWGKTPCLIGGLEHGFIFSYIGNNNPN